MFVIGGEGYQPDDYYAFRVYYGSCSGCDAFERISDDYSEHEWRRKETPEILAQTKERAVQEFWTLMLHMVQGMKPLHTEQDENPS